MMFVIMVIGLLAAMGIPSITYQLRDRRTNQAAQEAALIYRRARSLSIGRGGATLVRFTSGAGQGMLEMHEALNSVTGAQGTCAPLPASNCSTNSWIASGATPDNRIVTTFDPAGDNVYSTVSLQFFIAATAGATPQPATDVDICFTSLGRPYYRLVTSGTGGFQPLVSVPYIQVARSDGVGSARTVLVMPNGSSRLSL
jgi:type II secretory pathway pseudopilin PulG